MRKIFVNIASYRDPLLSLTVRSLIKSESGRNKITYGIFEQTSLEESLITKDKSLTELPNVRYKRIDPEYSDGAVWARKVNATQIYDEEFQYQIDSHMLFDKDWDHYLILDYNQAKSVANTEKIILTTCCKNFEVIKGEVFKHTLTEDITTEFKYVQFKKNLRLTVHGLWKPATKVVQPGIHFIAGNFFTVTDWIKDVGYNSNIFFEGEEQVQSLQSILAGYKIYYQRKSKTYHLLHTNDYITKQEINPIVSLERFTLNQKRSEKELIDLIYSIPESELERYRELTGVDYINRKLEERAITRSLKPDPDLQIDWEIPNQEKDE